MIVVTGGAGFIGSNLVRSLNADGHTDILVVDNLGSGKKFLNLVGLAFSDYLDKHEFRKLVQNGAVKTWKIRAIYHQGACSDTTQADAVYMLDNNYNVSKELFHFAVDAAIPFVYASSAAVYGGNSTFREEPAFESPLNVYGYSKLIFDNYVRRRWEGIRSTVVGLRYFNVYGPHEEHKGRMSSVVHQFSRQLRETGKIRLFKGSGGFDDGEQRRDFVFVGDVVRVNRFFGSGAPKKGIFNVGTGQSRSFNQVARAVVRVMGKGELEYIDFPKDLVGQYQSFTEADLGQLRASGYHEPVTDIEDGVRATLTGNATGVANAAIAHAK